MSVGEGGGLAQGEGRGAVGDQVYTSGLMGVLGTHWDAERYLSHFRRGVYFLDRVQATVGGKTQTHECNRLQW